MPVRLLASSADLLALVSPGGVEAHVRACLQPSKKVSRGRTRELNSTKTEADRPFDI